MECTDLLPSTWHLPEEQKSLTLEVFTSGPEDKGTPPEVTSLALHPPRVTKAGLGSTGSCAGGGQTRPLGRGHSQWAKQTQLMDRAGVGVEGGLLAHELKGTKYHFSVLRAAPSHRCASGSAQVLQGPAC